ncbi:MAG TPA: LuxR C-terminal-related transcriptional regulator [Candidatus Baltobacteraceae bacterium]|nr:LuxR C-terminal-related transcriptional regulator [Candidatus Baltobacteraceae bacterium]
MRTAHLTRPRLNDRLAHAARYPIVLVVAPAGFGKSVALADFLRGVGSDAVRFDVRPEESNLLAFARRFAEVLQPVVPGIAASFPALQENVLSTAAAPGLVLDWFAEHFKRTTATIVVDDLHFAASDPDCMTFLATLVERTAERISWILASRSDAGLPTASWLAYGKMDLPIDQNDLRFTLEEALATAHAEPSQTDASELESLWRLTDGWPVAFAIALRTQTQAEDLRPATTRDLIYRYLAEQVFERVSPPQRDFLLATSVFSSFDASVARALGGAADFIEDLRQGVAFLNEIAPGEFRYHDLFREYLESELLRHGREAWRSAVSAGARLLEERGDAAGALALYTKAKDAPAILRVLESDGFGLFERGQAGALGVALDAVSDDLRARSATALGLQAMLEAARGHFETASRSFVAGIALASRDVVRLTLVHRYAIELVRQGRDCIGLLEPYADDDAIAPALRVPILGTIATAYARASRHERAVEAIATALALLDPTVGDDARARLYQQAAYVYSQGPDHDAARRYASLSVDLALSRDLYDVAVRAYSALYTIAYDDSDEPIACLTILDKLLDCARKGGSVQGRLYGLIASYGIEADRGNEAALARIELLLDDIPGMLSQNRSEVLLPAMALRASWHGQFQRAYELLSQAREQQTEERRAEYFSELALYACAAGLRDETKAAIDAAETALSRWKKPTRRALRAQLMLAFAELTRARLTSAHRHLAAVKRELNPAMSRLNALAEAGWGFYRKALGPTGNDGIGPTMERLRAEQFGGIARLLEALPVADSAGSYAVLTSTEREILRLLAAGGSTKSMAERTSRSPRTIDSHVRSICKKLSCRSRRAVVALAIGAGWVENEDR